MRFELALIRFELALIRFELALFRSFLLGLDLVSGRSAAATLKSSVSVGIARATVALWGALRLLAEFDSVNLASLSGCDSLVTLHMKHVTPCAPRVRTVQRDMLYKSSYTKRWYFFVKVTITNQKNARGYLERFFIYSTSKCNKILSGLFPL